MNHHEQTFAENVKGLPTSTNDNIKADILTNSNAEALTENNHILENNNQSKLNRRDKLLKNDNTVKRNEPRISDLTAVYHRKRLHRSYTLKLLAV